MAIISDKIEFVGHDGVSRLAARFDSPERGLRASALFAHCFTCSKDIRAATRIARALAERGFSVLRFDFTGLGASEGEFANTDFSSNVQDLVAAARFMESSQGHGPDVLVGHSLGGAAVLAAAGEISSVKAVATIGAPAEPGHVAHLFRGKAEEITAAGAAEVEIAGRVFTVTKRFLDDISEQRLEANLAALRKALLIFHGPRDDTVGIENAAMIFAAARHPKSFVSLDDADHLLSREGDAIYVAEVLAAWAGRYIEDGAAEAETGEEAVPDKGVTVTEAGTGRFTQDIIAGGHRLVADEPKAFGGDERGPGPYDLLLAGLGACTSMTLRMYAERKGWPLERASVSLSHEKVHAEDCENCEEPGGRIDRIERTIRLDGPLDAAQRARMLEIADKCPVHKTLTGTIEILTREDES